MENLSTKNIANMTGLAESTVRKYSQLLESNGYVFNRNVSGYRVFSKQDIEIFLQFKEELKDGNSVEDTASAIATKYIPKPNTRDDSGSGGSQSQKGLEGDVLADLVRKIDVLTDMNNKQSKFNEELLKRLDQQQKYMDGRLKERDEMLVESLRKSQETQQLIAAAKEESEKKKGFFERLFNL